MREATMTLTAYKNGKLSFVWGMTSRDEAIRQAVRWLRQGRGRSAEISLDDRVIWYRG